MTPAMQQFHDVKEQYPDHIVLFRMGDFFETFYEDAKIASGILNITLTARDKEKKVPMAGIPFHALDNYLGKLIEANQKVVIVEQLENPAEAQGVVKRGVVKIVTPGTNTLETETKSNNYLVSLFIEKNRYQLAFIDVIEGTVYFVEFKDQKDFQNNLQILNPKEILIPKDIQISDYFSKDFHSKISHLLNYIQKNNFDELSSTERITEEIKKEASKLKEESIYALLNYLSDTQKTELNHINKIVKISSKIHMNLDSVAIRNLELTEGMRKGSVSLVNILDECKTSAGSKKLKNWIVAPLINKDHIESRLNSVASFKEIGIAKINELQDYLSQISDLYRISSKIGLSTANGRDLRNCIESIRTIFKLNSELKNLNLSVKIGEISKEVENQILKSQSVLAELDKIIREDPPITVREGGMIKSGIDADLDQLHELKTGGKEWLKSFQQKEIERTGIPTLKVHFNKVFGYYIEVSKGQSNKVPDDYIRKQTLVNAERYITPELKEKEAAILGADDRIRKLEFEIFTKSLTKAKSIISNIQSISDLISEIDIYLSFAQVSLENNWAKPEINESDTLKIENGRHPVIECLLKKEGKSFVKNNVCLDSEKSLQIITGPNMGGKSTFIRQIALITLLAQVGCFVPADSAEIGIVDRIFTRVGASDNLASGESTFMVEMLETSEILKNATSKSLIILDEVGRGTSTFDGMSIAWAICEYLQDIGAKTLFATHYHELTELSNKYSNIKNLAVKVIEHNGEIIFMHQIVDGKADKSYGIHVAKLAGIPNDVIKTSERILKRLEKEKDKLQPKPQDLFSIEIVDSESGEVKSNSEVAENLIHELKDLDLNLLTPIEALQKLNELKGKIS